MERVSRKMALRKTVTLLTLLAASRFHLPTTASGLEIPKCGIVYPSQRSAQRKAQNRELIHPDDYASALWKNGWKAKNIDQAKKVPVYINYEIAPDWGFYYKATDIEREHIEVCQNPKAELLSHEGHHWHDDTQSPDPYKGLDVAFQQEWVRPAFMRLYVPDPKYPAAYMMVSDILQRDPHAVDLTHWGHAALAEVNKQVSYLPLDFTQNHLPFIRDYRVDSEPSGRRITLLSIVNRVNFSK